MKNYSKELLIQKLGEMEFPDYSTYENVNEAYHDFATRLTDLIDILAPFKQVRVKSNSKPWFDGETLESIRVRDKLRKKYKKSGLQIDYENFKNAQKRAKQNVKRKKCNYVKGQLRDNIAKPKELWKILKSLGISSKSNNKIFVLRKMIFYFTNQKRPAIFLKDFMKILPNRY
jgi:hypothetical protein